ncbi:MAG: hypothetical protein LBF24_02320 [Puniceicoccales bacterium]|jgi:hypothetical protein|nr:hypothetical protein [Puniceicoccales bacterium]
MAIRRVGHLLAAFLLNLSIFSSLWAGQWDDIRQSLTFTGKNVLLKLSDDTYLTANRLYCEGGAIGAEGAVRLSRGKDLLLAEKLLYELERQTFSGEKIRFRLKDFYVQGESVEGGMGIGRRWTVFRDGRAYRGEPECHSPNFRAGTISLSGDDVVHLEQVDVCFGSRRLFSIPHWNQKLCQFPVRMKSKCGHRTNLGFYSRSNLSCSVTPCLRLSADVDYYSARGLLLGPGCRWEGSFLGQDAHMELSSGWIRDRGAVIRDFFSRPSGSGRNFLEGSYRQKVGEHCDIAGELHRWSDPRVLWDFRPGHCEHRLCPDSHIELTRWWKNSILTAGLVHGGNRAQTRTKNLQQLQLRTVPHALFSSPAIGSGSIMLSHKQMTVNRPAFGKVDGSYEVALPLRWHNTLIFQPCASGRTLLYDVTDEENSTHQTFAQVGVDVRTLIEGDWLLAIPRWDVGLVRHRISPLLQYRHNWKWERGAVPEHFRNDCSILSPINLCEYVIPDRAIVSDRLRLGLENIFQTARVRGDALRTIAELSLYEDFSFESSLIPSDIFSVMRLWPADFFSFNFFSRTDGKSFVLKALRLEAELWDGNVWKTTFGSEHLRGKASRLRWGFSYEPTSRDRLDISFRYDVRRHHLISQRYHYFHRFDRNWSLAAKLGFCHGPGSKEERHTFRIGLRLNY